ncbi:hypothetical protein [Glycomyces buryatensis]|uniref:S1 family peptidase n=1 Tax=Glycomyces buryatensis TaxID=2570927 RepID=A0A4S8QCX5_9ACTN|nr:hypothetical protein [Glycomyces buryatensis]THV40892.1 hypothetical protein FAB82_13645 [Glycomyces buryatensis]
MRNRLFTPAALAMTIGMLAAIPAAPAFAQPAPDYETNLPANFQTEAEALAEDLTLTAEANGWTYQEARAQYEAAEAIGKVAEQVAAEHSEVFVGSALSAEPGGAPTLYIKGAADREITSLATASEVSIDIVDKQPYSFDELGRRNENLIGELADMGYGNLITSVDITRGVIEADVQNTSAATYGTASVESQLSSEFSEGVELRFVDQLTSGAEHGFGGARVYGDSVCTSGWTVRHDNGGSGVTTAGHCNGIARIREDGVAIHDMTFRSQRQSGGVDLEWHSVDGHSEPARFYSSAGNLRATRSTEALGAISVGETICVYGRSTNRRICSAEVASTWTSCVIDGVLLTGQIRMNAHVTTGGDSGGGWSHGNRAYGSHVGHCNNDSIFMPVAYFSYVGLSVKTQ